MASGQTEEFQNQTIKLRKENQRTQEVYSILRSVAKMSETPLILEITNPVNVLYSTAFKNTVISKSTAEVMPFELLHDDDNKTSYALAEKFLEKSKNYIGSYRQISENHLVPDRPSQEELEGAFSRVLSKENYMDLPEFLEKFNEQGLESLEHIIPNIIMVHPEKTDKGHVGKILANPQYREINQRHRSNSLEICKYQLTNPIL